MDAELRKRLEDVAKEIANKKFPKHRASENDRRAREDYQLCRDSCIIGIELGHKEAIAQARRWLKENSNKYASYMGVSYTLIRDFEADMNRLWKEKKMTIEERCGLCSHCLTNITRECHDNCHQYSRYKEAVRQKEIDDKECEEMVASAVNEARQVFIEKACEWIRERKSYACKEWLDKECDDFRRDMEE